MIPLLIKVKKLVDYAKLPTKAHYEDAGWDFYAAEDILIEGGKTRLISLGVAIAVPTGYYMQFQDRSSMAVKGIPRFGGVIDCPYRGPLKVVLHNTNESDYEVKIGDKLVQGVLLPVPVAEVIEVDNLEETERGEGGFGSTGK